MNKPGTGAYLPPPKLVEHEGILVVRDDLIQGGTKCRALPVLFEPGIYEYVYASPVQGYAQVALGYCARRYGKKATVFCARRRVRHPRTLEAIQAGASIVEVAPAGYLSVVQARAKTYCEEVGAKLLPFGLDVPAIRTRLTEVARSLKIAPRQVWTVAGSGTLSRALQDAWPAADFFAVQVGHAPDVGRARLLKAPERFEDGPRGPQPPFPACHNYDAKAWRFIVEQAALGALGALFWNVAG